MAFEKCEGMKKQVSIRRATAALSPISHQTKGLESLIGRSSTQSTSPTCTMPLSLLWSKENKFVWDGLLMKMLIENRFSSHLKPPNIDLFLSPSFLLIGAETSMHNNEASRVCFPFLFENLVREVPRWLQVRERRTSLCCRSTRSVLPEILVWVQKDGLPSSGSVVY